MFLYVCGMFVLYQEGGDSDDEELPGLDNEEEAAEEDKPSA